MSELKFVCFFNTHIRLKIQNSHWHYKPKFLICQSLKNQKSFISSSDLHEKKNAKVCEKGVLMWKIWIYFNLDR